MEPIKIPIMSRRGVRKGAEGACGEEEREEEDEEEEEGNIEYFARGKRDIQTAASPDWVQLYELLSVALKVSPTDSAGYLVECLRHLKKRGCSLKLINFCISD